MLDNNSESVSRWLTGAGGRLRYRVGRGYVGPVFWQGSEIIRRIFVTVRDRNWQEVPPAQFQWHRESPSDPGVRLQARHRSGAIDFGWHGSFVVDPSGDALSFEIAGEVFADLDVCRLGLIVLHPVDSLIGNPISYRSDENGWREMIVSRVIHPQRLADGLPRPAAGPFRELSMTLSSFGVLEMKFAGERFEFEDQRNWGDASFKTYCTPLSEGFPRRVPAGSRINHRVDIRLLPHESVAAVHVPPAMQRVGNRFPEIGVQSSPEDFPYAWDHVCLDSSETPECSTEKVAHLSAGTTIELTTDLAGLVQVAPRLQGRKICRVLLHGIGVSPASAEALGVARSHLPSDASIFLATQGHFADLNRGDLPRTGFDGIAFPLCSTVHGDDAETIASNVPAIADMAATARRVTDRLAIAPLSLFWPVRSELGRFPPRLVVPWVVACVAVAAAGGVESITLEPHLVQAMESSGDEGALALEKLIGLSGSDLVDLFVAAEPNVHAVAAAGGSGEVEVLLANLNSTPALVKLAVAGQARGVVVQVDALSMRILSLDEGSGVEVKS